MCVDMIGSTSTVTVCLFINIFIANLSEFRFSICEVKCCYDVLFLTVLLDLCHALNKYLCGSDSDSECVTCPYFCEHKDV